MLDKLRGSVKEPPGEAQEKYWLIIILKFHPACYYLVTCLNSAVNIRIVTKFKIDTELCLVKS